MSNSQELFFETIKKSYTNLKNKYNYMSLKNAKTKQEFVAGFDVNNEPIYVYNNLVKKQIFLASPRTFNDPDEFKFLFDYNDWKKFFIDPKNKRDMSIYNARYGLSKDFNDAIQYCSERTTNFLADKLKIFDDIMTSTFEEIKDMYGVFCLAPSYLDDYFWMEYCNNYNGICCEYDIEKIKYQNPDLLFQNVHYSDNRTKYLPKYERVEKYSKVLYREKQEQILKILAMKSTQWNNEYENRLIAVIKNIEGKQIRSREITAQPIKIYIGFNVPEVIQKVIIDICNTNKINWEIIKKENCINSKDLFSIYSKEFFRENSN